MAVPITVIVAEDDADVRQALAELLRDDATLDLVGVAADAPSAIELAEQQQPQVALVDVRMPGGGGLRAAREIRDRSPATKVLALSAYDDRASVISMLRAGAHGYIVKGVAADRIVDSVHNVHRGEAVLSRQVTADIIDELVLALDRAERYGTELQRLNETKSELIQVISHEFLTPLTVVQGTAKTLAKRGPSHSQEVLDRLSASVERASERMRRLVGNLASIARIDRDSIQLSNRPISISEIRDGLLVEFATQVDRIPAIAADTSVPGGSFHGDRELVITALRAVIENALAFSPEDSSVDLTVRSTDTEVQFLVADRGIGIAEADTTRLFEPFGQLDTSTTRAVGGLGIGLYLARRIMAAHGGAIDLAPRPGGGSIFTLTFPAIESGTGP